MFSPKLLDHFERPRNVGELESPTAVVQVENPICGDELQLTVRADAAVIREVRYLTRGCTASIAVGSALTELLIGRSLESVRDLNADVIEDAVDGLPSTSKHAAALAADAVRSLAAELLRK